MDEGLVEREVEAYHVSLKAVLKEKRPKPYIVYRQCQLNIKRQEVEGCGKSFGEKRKRSHSRLSSIRSIPRLPST